MRPYAFSAAALVALLAACASETSPSTVQAASADAETPATTPETSPTMTETETNETSGLYAIQTATLDGDATGLSEYAGQVTLVVNVASRCGYTPQYKGLQELHTELEGRGFSVLAFPSNEFGGQEPGSPAEIREFCTSNFGVTFPMFAKCEVKPGDGQSPVYSYLQQETSEAPSWNFCKYLVGRDGQVIAFYPSSVAPDSSDLRKAIEDALG